MSVEKLPVHIFVDNNQASIAVAQRIATLIRTRAKQGKKAVLGLATGHTPINVYRELIRMHREENLSLANVVTFNLDEYWPIDPTAIQSYQKWMHENLFKHVNVPAENIHIPSGQVSEKDVVEHCRQYDQAIKDAGGIDIQILGIGRSGHVGFNEPGSSRDSRTRRVRLDRVTRSDAASDFFGEEHVPDMAISMGVGTILEAREICLLAFGEHKAPIIRRSVEGEVSAQVAASFLQEHPNAGVYVDDAAAQDLTRIASPWLVGPCQWDDLLKSQAVIWLAKKMQKPILKLTEEDYVENGLGELGGHGKSYNLNIEIFRHLMRTISGWPAGKEGHRRVLILSPHPDDDVICMAGTMIRLCEQGHEVHTAYMVSGYLSVFDHNVSRYADFVKEFNKIFGLGAEQSASVEQHIDRFLRHKRPCDQDSAEIQAIKGLIRRAEALDAAKFCGMKEEHVYFLDMPFYNTGQVAKLPISDRDVDAVRVLLDRVKPDIIFAAGDMSDPHGTHRQCLEAAMVALDQFVNAGNPKPDLWLYRGAWQEWPPEQINMAVPLSPDELYRKRLAIFRHESQKDRAMFPGPDKREFWQRAEDRNMATARLYDKLGLPEYHAIEAFARWPVPRTANSTNNLTTNK